MSAPERRRCHAPSRMAVGDWMAREGQAERGAHEGDGNEGGEQQDAQDGGEQTAVDGAGAEAQEGGGAADEKPAKKKRKKKMKKEKSQITFQKYEQVANSIARYLRDHEDGDEMGLPQSQVVAWYLDQQEDITSEEELIAERKLANRVIKRLVTRDNVLMVLPHPDDDEGAEERDEESRIIAVHPNYEVGGNTRSI